MKCTQNVSNFLGHFTKGLLCWIKQNTKAAEKSHFLYHRQ